MGLLGSAFGRGLAGAAAGASSLASRYIDEEITTNRAKMLEELRHGSMVKTDQYQNSPERQALLRQNATDATMAQGAATDSASLARLNNTELQGAQKTRKDSDAADETARKVSEIEAMTPAQIKAVNAKVSGTMGIEAQRAELIAEVQARISAKYRQSAGGGGGGRAQGAGQQGAPIGLDMANADKFINAFFTTKDDMTGKSAFNPTGAQAVRTLMLRMPAAQSGDTQGAVNQAMEMYQQAMQVSGGNHDKAMQAIQALLAPKATPTDEPVVQPPPAPEPGFWDRTMKAAGEVGAAGRSAVSGAVAAMRETGPQYEAIYKRWREAGRGGPPLTEAERVQARAFGLAVR